MRHHNKTFRLLQLFVLGLAVALLGSCDQPATDKVQGYVEGEFVYVASPLAGQLNTLSVERGQQVQSGAALFTLDSTYETAARDEANRRLTQSLANFEDAKKGKRPTEIESLAAQIDQARAALVYSEKEATRAEELIKSGAVTQQYFDQTHSQRDQDRQRVVQLEADLETARLGQRTDQVAAAQADVQAMKATLAQAEWNLSQKHQDAPQSGLVFDTLYRQGEWVAAGHPVVALLSPANVKVRAFVSETRLGSLHPGDSVQVHVDGVASSSAGKISFISPRSEYTPPVIYSQGSRDKLLFMIEIRFDDQTAANLHPGQPVDVTFDANPKPSP